MSTETERKVFHRNESPIEMVCRWASVLENATGNATVDEQREATMGLRTFLALRGVPRTPMSVPEEDNPWGETVDMDLADLPVWLQKTICNIRKDDDWPDEEYLLEAFSMRKDWHRALLHLLVGQIEELEAELRGVREAMGRVASQQPEATEPESQVPRFRITTNGGKFRVEELREINPGGDSCVPAETWVHVGGPGQGVAIAGGWEGYNLKAMAEGAMAERIYWAEIAARPWVPVEGGERTAAQETEKQPAAEAWATSIADRFRITTNGVKFRVEELPNWPTNPPPDYPPTWQPIRGADGAEQDTRKEAERIMARLPREREIAARPWVPVEEGS